MSVQSYSQQLIEDMAVRKAVVEAETTQRVIRCQFGSKQDFHPGTVHEVRIVEKASRGNSVYTVETTDGSRLLGRAFIPNGELRRTALSEQCELYAPRYTTYDEWSYQSAKASLERH